nr:hypothetical protein CFP56_16215 [Quercus suber]
MCVAGLNVCTQPCAHRWYSLVRSCAPHHNLANCPERLQLEGWETRNDSCPWCDDQQVQEATHRLFGSISSASSSTGSPSSPVLGPTRTSRSGSGSTVSSLSQRYAPAIENERAQRHREMNDRLNLYLTTDPHEVLPSAKKNYPTYGTSPVSSPDEFVSAASDSASLRSGTTAMFGQWRKKSNKLGRGLFKT